MGRNVGRSALKSLASLFVDLLPENSRYHAMCAAKDKWHCTRGKNASTFDFLSLVAQWEDIVGSRMAQHSLPLKLQGKALVLLSDHPGFSSEMSFLETQLRGKIITRFPVLAKEINRIQFQINPAFFQQRKKMKVKGLAMDEIKNKNQNSLPHPQSPQYRTLTREANKLFQEIEDDELKGKLTSIFMQARQKN